MKDLLKKYKHAWVFIYMIPYLIWYFGLQQISHTLAFTDIYISVDASLPFVPLFIWPYIYWYLFIGNNGKLTCIQYNRKKKVSRCAWRLKKGVTNEKKDFNSNVSHNDNGCPDRLWKESKM